MERSKRMQVGIDIGKSKADYALLHPDGQRLVDHCSFPNSVVGLRQARALLVDTLKHSGLGGVDIAVEATSYYWLPLFISLSQDPQLASFQPRLALLNAGWIKWFKKSFPPDHKSDQRDPFYIAERLRTLPHPDWWHFDPHWLSLRFYTRLRVRLSRDLGRYKNYYQIFLFLAHSSYTLVKPFSDPFGLTSQSLLSHPGQLHRLAGLPRDELAIHLYQISGHRLPDPDHCAALLQRAVQESYPLPGELAPAVHQVLDRLSQMIAFLREQIAELDEHILTCLDQGCYPQVEWLDSIPGLGPVFATGIAAEIGDLDRFAASPKWDPHHACYRFRSAREVEDALAKFAGLWWPENASGQFNAQERPLSKRGNAYLRYFILMAADRMRLSIPSYKYYYQKKLAEVKLHKHRRALVLTGRKALGLFVGLLHKHEFYRPEEVAHSPA